MKTSSLTLGFYAILLMSFSIVSEKFKIIDNAKIVVTVDNREGYDFFEEAIFDELRGDLKFKTRQDVSKLDILDESNNLMYSLPINTKIVMIGKNLFDAGNYTLAFRVADKNRIYRTALTVR